jgi:hypothetical protein
MQSDLEQLRAALVEAAQGDDVDALTVAAGRLTAALIRKGNGSEAWERLLSEVREATYQDRELALISGVLQVLRPADHLLRARVLKYVLRRFGIRWMDLT